MYYCETCKAERNYTGPCQFCGKPTRKLWWSFPKGYDGKHATAAHGFKVFYTVDGDVLREEEY